jgi:hypothetical protein
MSLRISSAAILLLLAGCNGGPPETVAAGNAGQEAPTGTPAEPPREEIACGGATGALSQRCTVERTADADGEIWTLRHPDGGFRRLRMARDGAISSADGAEPLVEAAREAGAIVVAVGGHRYRLSTARP